MQHAPRWPVQEPAEDKRDNDRRDHHSQDLQYREWFLHVLAPLLPVCVMEIPRSAGGVLQLPRVAFTQARTTSIIGVELTSER